MSVNEDSSNIPSVDTCGYIDRPIYGHLNKTADYIRESCINKGSNKIVVSFAIRKNHLNCVENRVFKLQEYAKSVGADFIFIDTKDHISLGEMSCPKVSPRFYKAWIIRYYLRQYKQVLYLDESVRISKSLSPNLFTLPSDDSNILAALERYDHEGDMREVCKHYGDKCSNYFMYNSGLMLFNQQYHAKIIDSLPACYSMKRVVGFEDQALFNVLFQQHGIAVEDLNAKEKVVLQGSEVCRIMDSGKEVTSPILHITRACRKHLCTKLRVLS